MRFIVAVENLARTAGDGFEVQASSAEEAELRALAMIADHDVWADGFEVTSIEPA